MNKVILIGRLTRNPELRYTSSNTPVATFTLAVNRLFSNQQGEREADFINVVVWRKQAENVGNYLKQGSKCAVEGRIQTRNYEDDSGNKRYITEIIAEGVEFLDSKKETSEDKNSSTEGQSNPFADFGSSIEISDDTLPF